MTRLFFRFEIPYENTTLPGYFHRVDESDAERPLLILDTGFDGSALSGRIREIYKFKRRLLSLRSGRIAVASAQRPTLRPNAKGRSPNEAW